MNRLVVVTVLAAFLVVSEVHSSRILVLYPFATKSHKNFPTPILQALVDKGHDIVWVSPYKTSIKSPHFTDVVIETSFEALGQEVIPNPFEVKKSGGAMLPLMWTDVLEKMAKVLMEDPQVQKLMTQQWDLVMVNAFVNELSFGIVHKINKPLVLLSAGSIFPWIEPLVANPSHVAYSPNSIFELGPKGSIINRVFSHLSVKVLQGYYNFIYLPRMRRFVAPYFDYELPHFGDIGKNFSMMLTNSHYSIQHPKPFLPNIIEAGGVNCNPAKPLPKDLSDFADRSGKHGFIYFSLGSVVQAKMMPEKYRKAFINAFEKLPYRVLWKWETEHMDDLPSNVKLIKWAPQQDILGHPKIRLFITHGGGLSVQETTYHGVPILGFPIFGDQPMNMKDAETSGIGISMNILDVTEQNLIQIIQKLIQDKSYSENVKAISAVFRDQKPAPLDLAVYWIEYVLRHNGARHLRSAAADMPWYQFYMVDVIAAIALGVGLLLGLLMGILILAYKLIRKLCCGKKVSEKDIKKKKN